MCYKAEINVEREREGEGERERVEERNPNDLCK